MSDGIHVMQRGNIWVVTRGNYTLDEFANRQKAIELAKRRAKSSKSRLVVHSEDGSVLGIEEYDPSTGPSRRMRRERTA